jgi:hypothetical protein
MIIWGGLSSAGTVISNIVDIFDFTSTTWTTGTAGGTARAYATANVVGNKMYTLAGCTDAACSGYSNTPGIYDIAANSWASGTAGGSARYGHFAGAWGNKITVWGGSNAAGLLTSDVYDTVSNSWSSGPTAGVGRKNGGSVMIGSKLYAVFGNSTSAPSGQQAWDTMDIFDLAGTTPTVLVVGTNASDPSTQVAGGLYYNTNDDQLRCFSGATGWKNCNDANLKAGAVIGGGFSLTDTTLATLTLDSSTIFSETAGTCSSLANGGSLYYNASSASNSIRACINGTWQDLASTEGLGLLAFGVVGESGSGAGDIASITSAGVNGPCHVSFVTTTTVKIAQGCTAYSGGRKVIVPDNTTPSGTFTLTNGNFVHVCLNGTNNQPAFSASGTEAANMPTFSVNAPVLCLADIKAGAGVLSNIYDVRTFTSTTKGFATLNATTGILGGLVTQTATAGVVQLASAIAQVGVRGVVVATAGSGAANNTVNMIIALRGTQFVKATATSAVNSYVQGTATAGYTSTAAISANGYGNVGVAQRTIDTLCTLTTNCQFSQLVDINPR